MNPAAKEKSVPFAPEIVTPLMMRGAVPELVTVSVCVALCVLTNWSPKLRAAGFGVMPGDVPVPEKATFVGLPIALCEMVSEAVRLPVEAGVKTKASGTLMPGLMVSGSVGVAESPNSEALVPKMDRPEITRSAVPVLLTVREVGLLGVPVN